jgi:hypothetical protein
VSTIRAWMHSSVSLFGLANGNLTIRYVRAETGVATRRDCEPCKPTSRTSKFYAEKEFVNHAYLKGSPRSRISAKIERHRHPLRPALESRIPRTLDETVDAEPNQQPLRKAAGFVKNQSKPDSFLGEDWPDGG